MMEISEFEKWHFCVEPQRSGNWKKIPQNLENSAGSGFRKF